MRAYGPNVSSRFLRKPKIRDEPYLDGSFLLEIIATTPYSDRVQTAVRIHTLDKRCHLRAMWISDHPPRQPSGPCYDIHKGHTSRYTLVKRGLYLVCAVVDYGDFDGLSSQLFGSFVLKVGAVLFEVFQLLKEIVAAAKVLENLQTVYRQQLY